MSSLGLDHGEEDYTAWSLLEVGAMVVGHLIGAVVKEGYELNCALQTSYVNALTLSTSACDYIWKLGLYRGD